MPIELSQELLDTAEWNEINTAYSANQSEMNQKRLGILSYENKQLKAKGIIDKSLQGDIEKQSRFMEAYGGIARFAGLDVDIKEVNHEVIASVNIIKNTPKIKQKETIPTEDVLIGMSHQELLALRGKHKTNKEINTYLAPFEHRAYARETVKESPELAPLFAGVLIPAYQAAKAVGIDVSSTEDPTTPASIEQLEQGYKGVGEGLGINLTSSLLEMFGVSVTKE